MAGQRFGTHARRVVLRRAIGLPDAEAGGAEAPLFATPWSGPAPRIGPHSRHIHWNCRRVARRPWPGGRQSACCRLAHAAPDRRPGLMSASATCSTPRHDTAEVALQRRRSAASRSSTTTSTSAAAPRRSCSRCRLWPEAPIYTSLYRAGFDLRGVPRPRHPHQLPRPIPGRPRLSQPLPALSGGFPLLRRDRRRCRDLKLERLGAHGARAAERAAHVVYCHTPARWLYRDDYMIPGDGGRAGSRCSPRSPGALRRLDRRAARRADAYIANSARSASASRPPTASTPRLFIRRSTFDGYARRRGASASWSSRACCPTSASI